VLFHSKIKWSNHYTFNYFYSEQERPTIQIFKSRIPMTLWLHKPLIFSMSAVSASTSMTSYSREDTLGMLLFQRLHSSPSWSLMGMAQTFECYSCSIWNKWIHWNNQVGDRCCLLSLHHQICLKRAMEKLKCNFSSLILLHINDEHYCNV
jgi:hypothetical protein